MIIRNRYNGATIVTINDADVARFDFSQYSFENADFARVNLVNANFAGVNLKNATFDKSRVYGANFTNAILYEASFIGADVQCANFTRADVRNTRWQGARMSGAVFLEAELNHAYMPFQDFSQILGLTSRQLYRVSGAAGYYNILSAKERAPKRTCAPCYDSDCDCIYDKVQ
jgi:uncharacterized protein YjbI with pentapeptide repeats